MEPSKQRAALSDLYRAWSSVGVPEEPAERMAMVTEACRKGGFPGDVLRFLDDYLAREGGPRFRGYVMAHLRKGLLPILESDLVAGVQCGFAIVEQALEIHGLDAALTHIEQEGKKLAGERKKQDEPKLPEVESALAKISPRLLLAPEKLKALKNDEHYLLPLGEIKPVPARKTEVQARALKIGGKMPGTKTPMPDIRILTARGFIDLENRLTGGWDNFADRPIYAEEVGAAWDRELKLIEAALPCPPEPETPPKEVVISGAALKCFAAVLWHELRHADGKGEFIAYRTEFDMAMDLGLLTAPISDFEIMKHIVEGYPPGDIAVAEDEFFVHCNSPVQLKAYSDMRQQQWERSQEGPEEE